MKTFMVLIVLCTLLTGCNTGQMATILGGSGYLGGAVTSAGYKYFRNGTITTDDINDIATTANTGYVWGNIAGDATDKAVMKRDIKKLKRM
jgi:hypothetical protein